MRPKPDESATTVYTRDIAGRGSLPVSRQDTANAAAIAARIIMIVVLFITTANLHILA